MKITIHKDKDIPWGEDHTIDTSYRDKDVYSKGCIIASADVGHLPLRLEIAIATDGSIIHRGYEWRGGREVIDCNTYLHVDDHVIDDIKSGLIVVTAEQKRTVSELFGGRKFDTWELHPGGSLQRAVGGIDMATAEEYHGSQIFLA